MTQTFCKYQGTGNDFVMIDNRLDVFDTNNSSLISHLCDRRIGVGADGLIVLESVSNYDFKMVYFNADGNESTMCGNGGRCIVAFANFLGIIKNKAHFLAIDGPHLAVFNDGYVELKMQDVLGISSNKDHFVIDTGSPHYVSVKSNLDSLDVASEGALVRYSKAFKDSGINVNFAKKINNDTFALRTYERGVEAETLSCGTGATAVAIAMFHSGQSISKVINLKTLGGELIVRFEPQSSSYSNVWLCGPAVPVFKGTFEW
jgi:diaminopimelate epimerase